LLNVPWEAAAVRRVVDELEAALPEGAWPNYVLGNHDEPRIAGRIGLRQARVAAMLLLTLRGTPTLYYGEEIGMTDVPIPRHEMKDPAGLRQEGQGRDPCRTPMQWSAAANAGFSPPETQRTWLPLAEDFRQVNVEAQLDQPTSLLNLYRRLLFLRRETLALQVGAYRPVEAAPDSCYVYLRSLEGGPGCLIALNFSSAPQRLQLDGLGGGVVLVSTRLDRSERVDLADLLLRPDEGLIVALD